MKPHQTREASDDWHIRLRSLLDRSEFKKHIDLARAAGVPKGTLSKYLRGGTKNPQYDHVRGLCKALNTDVDSLLYGGPSPVVLQFRADPRRQDQIPVVGIAQLGADGHWDEWELPAGGGDEMLDVSSSDPNAYGLEVRGDSMHPAIRDGWYVIAEPNRDPEPGEYVVVRTTSGESMVKELLWRKRGQVALESINNGYPRITLRDEDIEIIHPIGMIASPSSMKPRT